MMLASSSKRRHQFEHHGDFLALLGGAGEVFHQHRVGAGAIDGHLDGHHPGRRPRRAAGRSPARSSGRGGAAGCPAADRGEDVGALSSTFGRAGQEGRGTGGPGRSTQSGTWLRRTGLTMPARGKRRRDRGPNCCIRKPAISSEQLSATSRRTASPKWRCCSSPLSGVRSP